MKRLAVASLAALVLAGCGEPSIPRAASQDLQARVATIREALEGRRPSLARQQLTRLTRDVRGLLRRDVITEATGIEILEAAEAVRALVSLAPQPSPTVTETTTAPPPPPDEDDDEGEGEGEGHGHDEDKEKGEGKGKGNEGEGHADD